MNSKTNGFYGAIIGDIVGSAFERSGIAPKDYPLFSKESHITDDTVLTLATMDLLLKGAIQTNDSLRIATTYRTWGKRFPQAGYGGGFLWWLDHPIKGPYVSKGNGAAMRVSPVAYIAKSKKDCLSFAENSAEVTHNTSEGIKGATTLAVLTSDAWLGMSKKDLQKEAESYYPIIQNGYHSFVALPRWSALAEDTVPEAISAFLESSSFEDCIRKAIRIGGDTDTLASMAGSIAGAFYGIEESLIDQALERIEDGSALEVLARFAERIAKDSI